MTGLTPDSDPSKDGVPLDPTPSTRQGFGRMQLGNSLPLSSASSGVSRMQASQHLLPFPPSTRHCMPHVVTMAAS